MPDLPNDPVFTAVANALDGDRDLARRVLIALGSTGFVVVPAAQALEEVDLRCADVVVLRGYAAANPGVVTAIADRYGDKLFIALEDPNASIETLTDDEMEPAGWIRVDRHQRIKDELDATQAQLRELAEEQERQSA
jgi:hypothetical protein